MARVRSLRKVYVDDAAVQKLQDSLYDYTQPITNSAIIDGLQLVKIPLIAANSPQLVEHKLGRIPLGYIVTSRSANSVIWDSEPQLPSKHLSLSCSVDCVIGLWVY